MSTLEEEYGMRRTVELEKEMDGMCDYSVGIARKSFLEGAERGLEQGIEQGIAQGRIQQYIEDCQEFNQPREDVIVSVGMKFNLSDDDAQDAMNMYWKNN